MFRGKNPLGYFLKLTIISISFILGAYGCGNSITPTDQQQQGGGGGGSFLNPEMVSSFEGFLEFAIDKGAQTAQNLPANNQALKMDAVAAQQVEVPPLDFTDLQTFIAGLPVRVNGSVTVEQGDGQHTIHIDLVFSFCFALPESLPTLPGNQEGTAQITLPEVPELPTLPELTCPEGQEVINVRVVGDLIIDDETGKVIGGSLMINDIAIGPQAACEFLGQTLAELSASEDLLGFCEAP